MKSRTYMMGTLAGAMALASTALAAAPWSSTYVDTGDGDLGQPTLTLAPGPVGGVHSAAFQVPGIASDLIEHRATWTSTFGAPSASFTLLTDQAGAAPTVATDPSGLALVAWRESDGLHVRGRAANGANIPDAVVIPAVGGARIGTFRLATGAASAAAVVAVRIATDGKRSLLASTLSDVGWSASVPLASADAIPSLALAGAGPAEFHAAWTTVTSGIRRLRHTRGTLSGWSAPVTLPNVTARWVGIAMGANHRGAIAWITGTADRRLRTRSFNGMRLSPVTTTHAAGVFRADIDADATGRSVLAWPYRTSTRAGVWLRSGAKGVWTPPAIRWVGLRHGRILGLDVDVNPRGDAIVAWAGISNQVDRATHGATFRLAGGPFGTAEIRATKQDTRNPDPMTQAGVSPDGRALASHGLSSGNCCFDIAIAERPGVAIPSPSNLTVTPQPATGRLIVTFESDRAGRVVVAARSTAANRPSTVRLINARAGANLTTLPLAALIAGSTWRVVVGASAGSNDPGTIWQNVP